MSSPKYFNQHTGVDSMKVVEIRGETKSLDCAINVLLDMRSRVGDTAVSTIHAVEAAFRGNEDLVADIVFSDKVAKELFVDAGLIDNLQSESSAF